MPLTSLNKLNGADKIVQEYAKRLLTLVDDHELIGAELGCAFGGNVEAVAKLWKGRGKVYGFDTFEGHPKHLVPDQNDLEATCMDQWYAPELYGKEAVKIEYQEKVLKEDGVDNVILVKGLVNKDSCKDIPYLDYAFLDMDIYESMKEGYKAVRDKILPNHILFLHDVTPPQHLPRLYKFLVDEILVEDEDMWAVIGEWTTAYLVGLKKNETK